jgi:hypothetical protein
VERYCAPALATIRDLPDQTACGLECTVRPFGTRPPNRPAQVKLTPLVSEASTLVNAALSRDGSAAPTGSLKLRFRLRTPIAQEGVAPPAPVAGPGTQVGQDAGARRAVGGRKPAAVHEEREDPMEFANRLVSYNVLDFEIQRWEEAAKGAPESVECETALMSLRFRKEMLEMNVETGQLTMEAYLQTLRDAIKAEIARHKQLKPKPGWQQQALLALKHASIMKKELEEALAQ